MPAKLRFQDVSVQLAAVQQLFMRALRRQFAGVQQQNLIRLAHRADALRDDKRGATLAQLFQRYLNLIFRLGVH